ncbi:MAG: hypothetical protein MUC97_15695 [Bernardetiaceae bacterium]|jgi:hypothetical protein|nr:hypothetical protein [Bernardetiaceae bacterium]
MVVYESPYQRIELFAETATLENTWLPRTLHLTDEEFMVEQKKFADLIKQHGCRLILGNTQQMRFVITPAMHEWIRQEIFGTTKPTTMAKLAVVVSEDALAQLATEIALEEGMQAIPETPTRYFANREAALAWLHATA